ncbi:hypothetical protein F0562_023681 [Nyssa sinensis]|uniref:Disease resistance R13L4/SHOC-2-like LRR domain-containing protein n=1 Tax=Nyssa sinensis TaxID=561372 RepID=A0A5J5BIE4_9ASTE|nr:hypothetical protein F0562_023681 [Nyssa sinensis]
MGCCSSKNVDSKASRMARWRSTGIVALRDSKLKTFPDEVLDLDISVRTLDLTHNKLVDIPMEISKLINMQRLVLADNLIERLPVNLGKLQSLKVMTFDANRITILPDELGQLVRLERLSISGNLLTCLPETIGSLRNLILLNVSSNKLEFLPESIGSCFSLEELQANENSIEELPSSVCNLVHLKALCLNQNKVKQIPPNLLKECKALQNISLHDNPISMDQFQQMDGFQEFEARRKKNPAETKFHSTFWDWQEDDYGGCLNTKGGVLTNFFELNMVQKRPFGDEELYEISSKHPRQLEYSNQLVSFLEFVPSEDAAHKHQNSGEGEGSLAKSKTDGDEKIASQIITELPVCNEKDIETSAPGCISNASRATSSAGEEDAWSDRPFHLPFSLEYNNHDRPIRTFVYSEELYPSLLEYPTRKLVSIGPDFQADVPEWRPLGTKNTANCSHSSEPLILCSQALESDLTDNSGDENKLAGICVIPSPELEASAYNDSKVGYGRTDCCCQDAGSVRCVGEHIMEAREKLKRTLGQERFQELGFSDMGEVVAEKWSVEEEHLFHEVVCSNPASLGKNFWYHLSMAFPYRTKKDIVSYYFNVFVLRRRAEQNRCDSINIDSDNDEWQGSDDSGDDEFRTIEEDEDSVIESPVYHDDPGHNEIQGDESHEYDEDVGHGTCDNYENVDFGSDKGIANMSETCPKKLLGNCSSDPPLQLPNRILWGVGGDHDAQDDSCTSSDVGAAQQLGQVKANNSKPWLGSFNGMGGGGSHDYILEHCDSKGWDVGYLTCPKNEVDFLPTCSMIEEVFGVGAWNCKARDGKSLS